MSVKAMTWVFEQRLEPTDLSILIILADRADEDNMCFPGHDSILQRVNISRRTLVRRLASLEERGFMTRERRTKPNGARTSDRYYLNLSANLARAIEAPSNVPRVALTDEPSVETKDQSISAEVKSKRGTRLPEGWMPSPGVASVIRGECPGLDLTREHRKFSDHFAAATGAIAVKANWDATWRNWMRRACEYAEMRQGPTATKAVLDAQWAAFLNERPASSVAAFCPSHDGYPLPCEKCRRES